MVAAISVVAGIVAVAAEEPAPGRPASFRADVAPILVRKCLGCHNAQKAEGGLSMATLDALRRGGKTAGDAIVEPGDPDSSFLIDSVKGETARRMPFRQPPLNAREIATLTRWIREGAKFDGPSASGDGDRLSGRPTRGLAADPDQGQQGGRRECSRVSSLGEAPGGRLGPACRPLGCGRREASRLSSPTIRDRSRPWHSRPKATC